MNKIKQLIFNVLHNYDKLKSSVSKLMSLGSQPDYHLTSIPKIHNSKLA